MRCSGHEGAAAAVLAKHTAGVQAHLGEEIIYQRIVLKLLLLRAVPHAKLFHQQRLAGGLQSGGRRPVSRSNI